MLKTLRARLAVFDRETAEEGGDDVTLRLLRSFAGPPIWLFMLQSIQRGRLGAVWRVW